MAMATRKRLSQEIYDQFLVCKICFQAYQRPKTLACLHIFCTECLEKHMEAEMERYNRYLLYSRTVSCPICRKKTELPTGGVRRLPDNFLVSNLDDVISKRRTDIPRCGICLPVKNSGSSIPTQRQAVSKCMDCSKFLCFYCVELHRRTKVTKEHSLIDVEDERDIECKIHSDEMVKFYCEACEMCICVVCTFTDHKGHEVSSLVEGMERHRNSMDDLMILCKERVDILRSRLDVIIICENAIQQAEERIRDTAIESIGAIRKREKQMIEDLRLAYGEETMEYLKQKAHIQNTLENLVTACTATDIMIKDKGVELLLLKKDMQEKLQGGFNVEVTTPPPSISKQIEFQAGSMVFGSLNFRNNNNEEECVVPFLQGCDSVSQTDLLKGSDFAIQTDRVCCPNCQKFWSGSSKEETHKDKSIYELQDKGTSTICTELQNRITDTSGLISYKDIKVGTCNIEHKHSGTLTDHTQYANKGTGIEHAITADKLTNTKRIIEHEKCVGTLPPIQLHMGTNTLGLGKDRASNTVTIVTFDAKVGESVTMVDAETNTISDNLNRTADDVMKYPEDTRSLTRSLNSSMIYENGTRGSSQSLCSWSSADQYPHCAVSSFDIDFADSDITNSTFIEYCSQGTSTDVAICDTTSCCYNSRPSSKAAITSQEMSIQTVLTCSAGDIDYLPIVSTHTVETSMGSNVQTQHVNPATDHIVLTDSTTNTCPSLRTSATTMDSSVLYADTSTDTCQSLQTSGTSMESNVATNNAITNTPHTCHSDNSSNTFIESRECGTFMHQIQTQNAITNTMETETKNKAVGSFVSCVEKATYMPSTVHITTGTCTPSVELSSKYSATETTETCNVHSMTLSPKMTDQYTNMELFSYANQYVNTEHVDTVDAWTEYSSESICMGTNTLHIVLESRASSPIPNISSIDRGTNPTKTQVRDWFTYMPKQGLISSATASTATDNINNTTRSTGMDPAIMVHRQCSPIPQLNTDQMSSTKEVMDRFTYMPRVRHSDVGITTDTPDEISIVEHADSTTATEVLSSSRGSSPIPLLLTINGECLTENDWTRRLNVDTCDKCTFTPVVSTANKHTTMPHVYMYNKETETVKVITKNRGHMTQQVNTLNKQTSTPTDVAAVYNKLIPVIENKKIFMTRGSNTVSLESPRMVDKCTLVNKAELSAPAEQFQRAGMVTGEDEVTYTPNLTAICEASMDELSSDEELAMLNRSKPNKSVLFHRENIVSPVFNRTPGCTTQSTFSVNGRLGSTSIKCQVETGTCTPPLETEDKGITKLRGLSDRLSTQTMSSQTAITAGRLDMSTGMEEFEPLPPTSVPTAISPEIQRRIHMFNRGTETQVTPKLSLCSRSKSVGDPSDQGPIAKLFFTPPTQRRAPDLGFWSPGMKHKAPLCRKQCLDITEMLQPEMEESASESQHEVANETNSSGKKEKKETTKEKLKRKKAAKKAERQRKYSGGYSSGARSSSQSPYSSPERLKERLAKVLPAFETPPKKAKDRIITPRSRLDLHNDTTLSSKPPPGGFGFGNSSSTVVKKSSFMERVVNMGKRLSPRLPRRGLPKSKDREDHDKKLLLGDIKQRSLPESFVINSLDGVTGMDEYNEDSGGDIDDDNISRDSL